MSIFLGFFRHFLQLNGGFLGCCNPLIDFSRQECPGGTWTAERFGGAGEGTRPESIQQKASNLPSFFFIQWFNFGSPVLNGLTWCWLERRFYYLYALVLGHTLNRGRSKKTWNQRSPKQQKESQQLILEPCFFDIQWNSAFREGKLWRQRLDSLKTTSFWWPRGLQHYHGPIVLHHGPHPEAERSLAHPTRTIPLFQKSANIGRKIYSKKKKKKKKKTSTINNNMCPKPKPASKIVQAFFQAFFQASFQAWLKHHQWSIKSSNPSKLCAQAQAPVTAQRILAENPQICHVTGRQEMVLTGRLWLLVVSCGT